MRYLIERLDNHRTTFENSNHARPGSINGFGLFDVKRSLVAPIATFERTDEQIANDIAEMLNNREGFWASQRIKPSARHHAGTSPPRFGA